MNFNEKAAKGWEKKDFESTENITGSIQAMKDTTRVIQDNEFLDFGYVMALILYELGTPENMVHFTEETLVGNTIYSQKWIIQHVASKDVKDTDSEVYKLFFLWFRASAILQTKGRHLKECCHPQWYHLQPFSPTIILRYLGEWKINENHMSRSTSIPDSELPNWTGFKGDLKLPKDSTRRCIWSNGPMVYACQFIRTLPGPEL